MQIYSGTQIELTLTDAGDDDRLFGRIPGGPAVFVHGRAVPGDRVLATVTKVKKRLLEADLDKILEEGPNHAEPKCQHFGKCGGCKWQNATPELQEKIKRKRVFETLKRIGDFKEPEVRPVRSGSPYAYRNKLTFHVERRKGKLALGFREARGSKFVPINHCHLASDALNDLARSVLDFASLPESITVRETEGGERQIVEFSTEADDALVEDFCGLKLEIPPRAFFQVNTDLAEDMVEYSLDIAQASDRDRAVDLFCGIGTITLPFAQHVGEIIGLESGRDAVRAARRNATRNAIDNASFDVRDLDKGAIFEEPTLVLADPPRAGLHQRLLADIVRAKPKRMVYISCNPATYARDAKLLGKGGLKLKQTTPFDLFPQTDHVEVVGLFERDS